MAAVVWLTASLAAGLVIAREIARPAPAIRVAVEEPFSAGVVSPQAAVAVSGFRATPRGYALPPNGRGAIEYRLRVERPLTAWSALTLQWYGGEPGIASRIEWVGNGPPRLLAESRNVIGGRLALPREAAGRQEIWLRFSAANAGERERLILDKLVLQSWEGPLPTRPRVWVPVLVGLAVAAVFAGLSRSPWRTAALGAILLLALGLRLGNLERVLDAPLDPDARNFREYAHAMTLSGPTGFYSAAFGEREPLYPALVKAALAVFGDTDTSVRLLSLSLSMGVVALGYGLGRSLLGPAAGLAAAALLAVSVPAIIESGRGLRVELEALLFTGSAWLWLGRPGSLTFARGLLGGLVGGALLLTRFPYAPTVGLLLLAAAWWHRQQGAVRWAALGLALVLAAAAAAPHRVALAARHGDAAYDAHRTLRWIANQEFQGQPGFPSVEEVVRDPYAGPRITVWEYAVRLHTPGELLWRSGRGLVRAVQNLGPIGYAEEVRALSGLRLRWLDGVVAAVGALGCALLLRGRATAWVPLAAFLGLMHMLFLYDLGLPDYRFRMILQASPLFAAAAAAGGGGLLAWARACRPAAAIPRGAP
jgi:hypothetical protein